MHKHLIAIFALAAAAPAAAQEHRELDAHEHGVGALNMAFDGNTIAIELEAPGADIVGFEYAAESAEDRAAVDAAVATLARPLELFELPAAAGCSVTSASAVLVSEEHDDHEDHEEHAEEHDDDHEEHEEDHEEHAEEGDEHEHEEGGSHSEFRADYTLTCADPAAVGEIEFAYFDQFENARELEVQVVTGSGAQAFEVERDAPVLNLRDMF